MARIEFNVLTHVLGPLLQLRHLLYRPRETSISPKASLCSNLYGELSLLLAYGFITGYVDCWFWNQARWYPHRWCYPQTSNHKSVAIKLRALTDLVDIDEEPTFTIFRRSTSGLSAWRKSACGNLLGLHHLHPSYRSMSIVIIHFNFCAPRYKSIF